MEEKVHGEKEKLKKKKSLVVVVCVYIYIYIYREREREREREYHDPCLIITLWNMRNGRKNRLQFFF